MLERLKGYNLPDFNNCNINISATLAEFLNAPNKNTTLSVLKNELSKNYKNVVFICFDGMGIYPLKQNLSEDSFLRRHIVQNLVSTFPSTTTNATTSLKTNLLPLEHGWFGWSLHFADIDRNIDIYTHCDSKTGEKVDYNYPLVDDTNAYYDHANTDYQISTIFPPYVKVKNEISNNAILDANELYETIYNICNREGKQFIYAYCDEPDHTMHTQGVNSFYAKSLINRINKNMERLAKSLKDTLFIITSDHGHIDVNGYVEFYKDKELYNMLECPPYLDARTPAFIVKEDKKQEFYEKFTQKYGDDFILFKSKELIDKGFFGNIGDKGYLLGDFISIGTYTNKILLPFEDSTRFKGHHTSLTDEMLVPLILIGSKILP